MILGLENLLSDSETLGQLKGKRVGLVAHPASVDHELRHSADLLTAAGVELSCLFGPQHGIRGEKQDNMIESEDFLDSKLGIPVYSLYGKVRRPTPEMIEKFDILLFDLQDVGCRIYTYLTTLVYLIEELSGKNKPLWVLDRPNPAGRKIEGTYLERDFFSFVGWVECPMRHGLTLGEMANFLMSSKKFDLDLKVIPMKEYSMSKAANWGWPEEMPWVNPSPNLSTVTSCRIFCGSVLIEGTFLSEGRGTTRALEVLGAPFLDGEKLVVALQEQYPHWIRGCKLRPCFFEPTFQKLAGRLCSGFQVHVDNGLYEDESFFTYRLFAAALRLIHEQHPKETIFKQPPYEYEEVNLPIEILSGSKLLKDFVEGRVSAEKFDESLTRDETRWAAESRPFHLYQ